MWNGGGGFAPAAVPRYRGGVSLRRFRYQLRCAAKGHDTRPYLVAGSVVEHRCLRCGALVGDPEPAASSARGPAGAVADDPGPHAGLPEPLAPPVVPNGRSAHVADEGDEASDESPPNAALAALRELGDLHAAGVLTESEFAAKKAELLRRV
jgi:hypothetical protein